jgi:hypothetical protein
MIQVCGSSGPGWRFDLGVAAMVGLEFDGVAVAVGDEAVIGVRGEQGELGAKTQPSSATGSPRLELSAGIWTSLPGPGRLPAPSMLLELLAVTSCWR